MNEIKPIIAERIKTLRKEKGYTQGQLAEILDLNAKSSIANYESGANAPSDDIKLKMCQIFECSMDYLMGITSYKQPVQELESALSKFKLSSKEYIEIKKMLKENSYNPFAILNNVSLPEKFWDVFKTLSDFTADYSFTQIITKLNGERTGCNSIRLPNSIHDNLLCNELDNIDKITSIKFKNLIEALNEKKFLVDATENFYVLPILNKITPSQPILVDENIEGYLPTDPNLYHLIDPSNYFYLKANDSSMNKIIAKNTYILLEIQNTANAEDIVLVSIDNKEPVIRKCVKLDENMAIFQSLSEEKSELEIIINRERTYEILGKMIAQINIIN